LFKREHHLRIATILQSLNADILKEHECYFGGGTAIVLARDEYRESVDIDFLVSDKSGYRELRQLLTGAKGIAAIVRPDARLISSREIRADQYGIRTMLKAGNVDIKFEIVFEGRITLDSPSSKDRICGVTSLTELDMGASKLLANSDRWSDTSVFNRDVIDLAMLELPTPLKRSAIEKAKTAYGDSIDISLKKSIDNFKNRRGWLSECMNSLKIDTTPEALVWKKIRNLIK
jgi:hypothetical protein